MNPHPRSLGTLSTRAWLSFVSLVTTTFLACLLASATIVEAGEPTWSATGSLATARYGGHTTTLLANGKVLLVGGCYPGCSATGSAELYDPATGTWSLTANPSTARTWHSATLLPNGKVLVAGPHDVASTSAELYDPATGTWSYTGNLSTTGGGPATLLPNGKVLVVWGNSGELYDPGTGTWRSTGNLNKTHSGGGAATLLPNGKVLVVGGTSVDARNSAELYDPATETWSVTGNLNTGRWYGYTAMLLPNGKVLVVGGSFDGDDLLESAELYDPVTGTWSETGDLNEDRGNHTATLLPNGKVLVAGGYGYGHGPTYWQSLNSAELYDPDTESWTITPSMNTARAEHPATLLANGKVLVVGGDAGSQIATASAELFDSGDSHTGVELNQHGLTGSWYNPASSGQGLEVEMFPDLSSPGNGLTQVSWFTYDTIVGGADHQRWYTLSGPVVTGQPTASLTIYQNTGGNFDAPPATSATAVGNATLNFDTCTSGQMSYTFTDGSGRTGTVTLSRLTQNMTCSTTSARPTNADFALSGNWYDAATSGQGFTIEVNPNSSTLFFGWFTYAPSAANAGAAGQRWYTGQAGYAPGSRSISVQLYETTGGTFNAAAPAPNTVAVGSGTLAFQTCSGAMLSYSFTGGSSNGASGTITLGRIGPVPQGCVP